MIFIIIVIIILLFGLNMIKEKYENYYRGPYNYIDNGASPLTYYEYPIYREPYEYPYSFYKSYPVPHLSYADDKL